MQGPPLLSGTLGTANLPPFHHPQPHGTWPLGGICLTTNLASSGHEPVSQSSEYTAVGTVGTGS